MTNSKFVNDEDGAKENINTGWGMCVETFICWQSCAHREPRENCYIQSSNFSAWSDETESSKVNNLYWSLYGEVLEVVWKMLKDQL